MLYCFSLAEPRGNWAADRIKRGGVSGCGGGVLRSLVDSYLEVGDAASLQKLKFPRVNFMYGTHFAAHKANYVTPRVCTYVYSASRVVFTRYLVACGTRVNSLFVGIS